MSLQGQAAVAMWWRIAPDRRADFEDWHSHEHFPERLGIPGFLRGSRWADAAGGDGYFVLYELAGYEVLTSDGYRARLNDPTPWSVALMPHHRDMVRSQCRIVESHGGGVAGTMATLRLSPRPGRAETLHAYLRETLQAIASEPGVTGGHLLWTETPAAEMTREQAIRGGQDGAADWILLVSGYDPRVVEGVMATSLGAATLADAGAAEGQVRGLYRLAYTLAAGTV